MTRLNERFAWALLLLFPALLASTRAGMDIALSLIALCFIVHSVSEKQYDWLRQAEIRLILLLSAYVAISAWRLTPADAENAAGWVRFALFYAALRYWLLTSRAKLERYALWLLAVLGCVAIDTYVQYCTGTSLSGRAVQQYQRLTGPLKHANIGNYLLKIALPLSGVCFALIVGKAKKYHRAVFALGLFMVFCLIPLSGERTITFLLLIAMGLSACLTFWRVPHYRRAIAPIACIVFLTALVLAYTQPVIGMRFAMLEEHVGEFDRTPYGQLLSGALLLAREHPVLGIGYEQYYESCLPLRDRGLVAYCDIHPHNTYLQWLVETGLSGLALFLAFITVLARQWVSAWRNTASPADSVAVIAAGVTLAICFFPISVTQSVFSNWSAALMWFSISLATAVFSVLSRVETP